MDPKHPQARVLLKRMVDQAQKSYRDARILAVQGKLQHAVQCVNNAIDNNPLDPSFFLFRYWGEGGSRRRSSCVVPGARLGLLCRPQFPHLTRTNLSLLPIGSKASWGLN